MRGWIAWLWFLGLALAQGVRLELAFEGQLPLGGSRFRGGLRRQGPLFRLEAGYDCAGPFALVELGFVLQKDGARRRWLSAGGGAYFNNEAGPLGRPFFFLHAGAGVYDEFQNLGV